VTDYPAFSTTANHVEPCPRRIRATLRESTVFDTTRAKYVWEWPYYPQFYIPAADVRQDLLVPTGMTRHSPVGVTEVFGVRVGDTHRSGAVQVVADSKLEVLKETVRFEWSALDAWFEEDERIFVHPRNPYVRVDALRSTRTVRVELEGTVLAESSSPVMVFETGLPTRYYLNRTEIDFAQLVPTDTVTECPYKGTTSGYWSIVIGGRVVPDVAWTYDFPTRQVLPVAGLVAFYNERVDIYVDGERQVRPVTRFSGATTDRVGARRATAPGAATERGD
jgi:uncharacterized protein (DUF427 family)